MFAERLKFLREERKLTQVELGKILNISNQAVSTWEKDKEPNYDTLKKIANYFNVSIDYLLGNTDVRDEIYKDKKLCEYLNECIVIYNNFFKDQGK